MTDYTEKARLVLSSAGLRRFTSLGDGDTLSAVVIALREAHAAGVAEGLERAAKCVEAKHTNNVGMIHSMAISDAEAIRALKATP